MDFHSLIHSLMVTRRAERDPYSRHRRTGSSGSSRGTGRSGRKGLRGGGRGTDDPDHDHDHDHDDDHDDDKDTESFSGDSWDDDDEANDDGTGGSEKVAGESKSLGGDGELDVFGGGGADVLADADAWAASQIRRSIGEGQP